MFNTVSISLPLEPPLRWAIISNVWVRRVLTLLGATYVAVVVAPLWLISGALSIIITAILVDVRPTPWPGVAVLAVLDIAWLVATWLIGVALLARLRRQRAVRMSDR